MKRHEVWIVAILLGVTFLAICVSSRGWLPISLPVCILVGLGIPAALLLISLPVCILVGLGIPAALLLWWNRRELSEILNMPQAPPKEEYPEDADLKKAA